MSRPCCCRFAPAGLGSLCAPPLGTFWAAARVIPTSIAAVVASNLVPHWTLLFGTALYGSGNRCALARLTGQPVSTRSVPPSRVHNFHMNNCFAKACLPAQAASESTCARWNSRRWEASRKPAHESCSPAIETECRELGTATSHDAGGLCSVSNREIIRCPPLVFVFSGERAQCIEPESKVSIGCGNNSVWSPRWGR